MPKYCFIFTKKGEKVGKLSLPATLGSARKGREFYLKEGYKVSKIAKCKR